MQLDSNQSTKPLAVQQYLRPRLRLKGAIKQRGKIGKDKAILQSILDSNR